MFQPKERTLMQFFYPFLLIPRSIKKIPYFIRSVTQSIIPVTGHYAQKSGNIIFEIGSSFR